MLLHINMERGEKESTLCYCCFYWCVKFCFFDAYAPDASLYLSRGTKRYCNFLISLLVYVCFLFFFYLSYLNKIFYWGLSIIVKMLDHFLNITCSGLHACNYFFAPGVWNSLLMFAFSLMASGTYCWMWHVFIICWLMRCILLPRLSLLLGSLVGHGVIHRLLLFISKEHIVVVILTFKMTCQRR